MGSTFQAVPLAYYSTATTDGTNITSYDLKDAGLAAAVKDALDHSGITPAPTENASNPMVWVAQHLYQTDSTSSPWAGKLRDFLDKLQNEPAFKSARGMMFMGSGNKVSVTVTPGIYAIVDKTSTPKNAAIIALNGTGINGMTKLVNSNTGSRGQVLGTVEYKSNESNGTAATVDAKKAIKVEDDNHGGVAGSIATTQIGKNVTFEIDSTIPNWTGYNTYKYQLNDKPDAALTFNNDSNVKVTVTDKEGKNPKTLVKGTDYTVSGPTDSDTNIYFIFGSNGDIVADKANFPVAGKLVVTYTMRLNKNAKAGTAAVNKATVSQSHNPNNPDDLLESSAASAVSASVYTGKVSFHKTDMQGNPLSGAQFQLQDAANSNAPVSVVKTGDSNTKGQYRVADKGETGVTTLDTDDNGNLVITGVDGFYNLKETRAPSGFDSPVLANPSFFVSIASTGTNIGSSSVNGIQDNNGLAETGTDGDTVHVMNARNILEMPKTGAAGILMNVIIALLLVAAGVTALLIHRHNKKVASAK